MSTDPPGRRDASAHADHASRSLPPEVTMGLLRYLATYSVDQDYAAVADRRRDPLTGRAPGPRQQSAAVTLVVLGLFGLLIATAALQTQRQAPTEESNRQQLITQIEARKAGLESRRAELNQLQTQVQRLQRRKRSGQRKLSALQARVRRLAVLAGTVPVTGPGVKVVVDDAPHATSPAQHVLDRDLQRLANALWQAGAEAISINGERLTSLTSIRHAGSAITVNYRSLSAPYTVLAIGNPDTLPARFVETRYGAAWLDLEDTYGLQFTMTAQNSITIPAEEGVTLHYAEPRGQPADDGVTHRRTPQGSRGGQGSR